MTSFLENRKHLRMDAQGEIDPTMGLQYRHNWVESSQDWVGEHFLSRSLYFVKIEEQRSTVPDFQG